MSNSADFSLVDLFREEAQSNAALLTKELLALEGEGNTKERLESLMRAAHSVKGAARIVGYDVVVRVAHTMEDCFVAAQDGRAQISRGRIDALLSAVDLLHESTRKSPDEVFAWGVDRADEVDALIRRLTGVEEPVATSPAPEKPQGAVPAPGSDGVWSAEQRISASQLDRLLGTAGEALVASKRLVAHVGSALQHRRAQQEVAEAIDQLVVALMDAPLNARARHALSVVQQMTAARQTMRRQHDTDLEAISQAVSTTAARLYDEVLDTRMRPFADGTVAFPRLIRDLARDLGKDLRLVVQGEGTPVDREVMRRLDAPLGHLLRNAVDHAIERPDERRAGAKPERGTIVLSARHGGGRLLVTVEDDGSGIDIEALRAAVVRKGHNDSAAAAAMSDKELLEFLFLPGFSMRDEVTSISGRGVGLDAVRTSVHEIGGTIRVTTSLGKGTRFELQLPLTLSIVRALIADIGGQPYAVPLSRIRSVRRVPCEEIQSAEGRQHFSLGDRQIGLLWAHQILGLTVPLGAVESVTVIVVDDMELSYGVAVDKLLGEREVVLRGLDAQLGKVPNIGAAALLPDGRPVLVLDVDDVVRSIANLLEGIRLDPLRQDSARAVTGRKRVLVVEDSLTVRELERKLIQGRGYDVDLAVDGMDGWNAVRARKYDLIVTDVDMPRLDGIELISLIRKDAALKSLPIMVVSYKDREEDRRRGMEAGADHYITKASFYDETMLRSIEDLIGAPHT